MRGRRRRRQEIFRLKTAVKYVCILGFCLFIIVQTATQLQLTASENTISASEFRSVKLHSRKIGEFGETVINMLPEDLAFTLFLPSERAFERDLGLVPERSLANESFAILTRVLGFSALPRWIHSADLEVGKEVIYHSISGFGLYIRRDSNQTVIVNGVASELVDLKIGKDRKTLVHVMDGVVMDSEFEESIQPEIE
ncbi:hypothetical protein F511_22604 [Dorcoceras hygrometricum]|uniref:FAS1 domain-containing protein n=1 Tax=Dorcoceras hygrometricum TaxID=472368 RepID=A0A2Z7CBC4_9LAMI|nr:hypothetical protein F511_22604 [Dorcoceras hygrometricum]